MIPDIVFELSVEQLFTELNKKLFAERTSVRLMTPLASRAHVATLAAKVRFCEPKRVTGADEITRSSTNWRNEPKRLYKR